MRAPAPEIRKINIQTRSGYMRRNESFWIWGDDSLDEARTEQFGSLIRAAEFRRVFLHRIILPGLKRQHALNATN
jgi:hypothetical protein